MGIAGGVCPALGSVAIPLQDSLALGPGPIQLGASIAWLMETLMKGLNFPEAPG